MQGKVRPLEVPQEYIEGSGIIQTANVSPSRQYSTVGGRTLGTIDAGSGSKSTMNKLNSGHPLLSHLQTPISKNTQVPPLDRISETASSTGAGAAVPKVSHLKMPKKSSPAAANYRRSSIKALPALVGKAHQLQLSSSRNFKHLQTQGSKNTISGPPGGTRLDHARASVIDSKIMHISQFEKAMAESTRRPAQEQISLNKTFLNQDSSRDLNTHKAHHNTIQASKQTIEDKERSKELGKYLKDFNHQT